MSALEFVSTFFTPTYLFLFLNLIIGTIYITSRLAPHHPAKPHQPAPIGRAPSSLLDRVRSFDLSFYKFESHPEPDPVHYHYNPGQGPQPLVRAPSLLDRFRSINLYQKKFEHPDLEPEPEPVPTIEAVCNSTVSREPPPLTRAPSLLDQLKSINFYLQKSDPQTDPEPVDSSNPAPLARAPSLLECVRSIKFPSFYNRGEPESDHEGVDGPAQDHAHGPVRRIRSESERMGEKEPKPRMTKTASEKSAAAAEENVEVEEIDEKADDFIKRFRHQLRLQRLDSIMRYKDLLTGGGGAAH